MSYEPYKRIIFSLAHYSLNDVCFWSWLFILSLLLLLGCKAGLPLIPSLTVYIAILCWWTLNQFKQTNHGAHCDEFLTHKDRGRRWIINSLSWRNPLTRNQCCSSENVLKLTYDNVWVQQNFQFSSAPPPTIHISVTESIWSVCIWCLIL